MSDSMEASKKQQPGLLEWLSHNHCLLVLHLLSVVLLTGLLVAVLIQGIKGPSSPGYEKIHKQLLQLKGGVESFCRPCPWEWTFFNGKCYFFSMSHRNWNDSITACLEVEAQLVIVESHEEKVYQEPISHVDLCSVNLNYHIVVPAGVLARRQQTVPLVKNIQTFLSVISKDKNSWLGLSDLKEEGSWQWVDGSPMADSFRKYWKKGEPNNLDEEDCAVLSQDGWNDNSCSIENFWICKKPASPCSR